MTTQTTRIREIPYNYTSFSDREIIIRLLGESQWQIVNQLRAQRRTGRSARMLFEVLGDIWVIQRNPFIQDDLINNQKRRDLLIKALYHRLRQIFQRANNNPLALRLHDAAYQAVQHFENWFNQQATRREQVFKQFAKITRKDNICFDGFNRVSHVTDATDWRVEYPFVVLYPDSEAEVADLVKACIELNLTIIPRGGGTGYTGGTIPLDANSAVINTEKLQTIHPIEQQSLADPTQPISTIRVEAGVITNQVAQYAAQHDLIFAVDPTSQDASTIGGNIAMNAGGKKAVLWGTTLDNLIAWRMVTPQAEWLTVERLNHNLGKIHDQPYAEFRITRYAADGETQQGEPTILRIDASEFRKPGLGKDVTNKFLGGLPGVQKEGCDGLITSAVFVLYPQSTHSRTICLEFFGSNLQRAVPAIVETKTYLDSLDNVLLSGMEHLDERYIRAVKYSTKANRPELPKMLLLIDIASEAADVVDEAAEHIVKLANARQGEGFIARTTEARNHFWQDRKRTAAIAAHTNAFKINEDVVIPLEKLSDYNDAIERINIEYSTANKIRIIDAVLAYLEGEIPEARQMPDYERNEESEAILARKKQVAQAHLQTIRQQWQTLMEKLDAHPSAVQTFLSPSVHTQIQAEDTVFTLLQRRDLRISYRDSIAKRLQEIFSGHVFTKVREKINAIHAKIRTSRLFVATHAHAGDGNVHTNIPVNSNDYQMMQEAEQIVSRVMNIAEQLGGVISGEHGIGLTKIQYLPSTFIEKFATYKQQVDPEQVFNRGKLSAESGLQNAYTPSLRLLEQEALILEASELGELNQAVKDCLRCGKCKPLCNTHVPRANLLYSPRNKILTTGLIIEAFLYEEQTRRGISLRHFDEMNDVADHCTVCHKCLPPCPVNIDFGDVTIQMRSILKNYNKRRTTLGSQMAMRFLNIADVTEIKVMRKGMIEWGFAAQRLAYDLAKRFKITKKEALPAATTGKMTLPSQIINFVKKPMPQQVPSKLLRSLLDIEDPTFVPIIRDPAKTSEESEAVFYFPGCGSERLFSQIGLASLALLYELGIETVLPPGYLCCGYPQTATGDIQKGMKISTRNRVLFHRVANTLNYMDIKTVLVSCGTCMDQLLQYEFEQIFSDCRLLDIHEYLLEKGLGLTEKTEIQYLYHDPCHTPMKTYAPIKVASQLMGQQVNLSDRCCGEAGTFAIARPDIATQVRFRKQQELHHGIETLTGQPTVDKNSVKLLTSCPACMQGLSRYRIDTGLQTDYIVVELAQRQLGENWQQQFLKHVQKEGIERVLL